MSSFTVLPFYHWEIRRDIQWMGNKGDRTANIGLTGNIKNLAVVENEFSYPRHADSGVVTMAIELLWFLCS